MSERNANSGANPTDEADGFSYTSCRSRNGTKRSPAPILSARAKVPVKSGMFCRLPKLGQPLLSLVSRGTPVAQPAGAATPPGEIQIGGGGMTPEPTRATEDVLWRVQGEFLEMP